jgi:hypothetical protein
MKGWGCAAAGLAAALLIASGLAAGGSTLGFGNTRTAHLSDEANGITVAVPCPETLLGFVGFTYRFNLSGSSATHAATYNLSVIVSPHSDTRVSWNVSVSVPAGAASTSAVVVIPPDALPFTVANTPFTMEMVSAGGALVDSVDFSVDLRYREPPPDGGLLALALASACVWGVVLLFALNLHFTQRKLRSRADALERAHEGPSAGGRTDGRER